MPFSAGKTLAEYKAPYPEPTADQRRYVIFLEPKDHDAEQRDFKVELIPGQVIQTDGVNIYNIGGEIKKKTIKGWGYTYYVVTLGGGMMTCMGALGDAAKLRPRFVSMQPHEMCGYNSRLPIVVYMPKDGELHYRIWSAAGSASGKAKEIKATEM
ncbi:ecotin [Novymonas esmeraldas]|uniref:Ecotin n=1 Tax=Novymonas esmeraldas TaxID=1808958 RepID=A0AAW0F0B2_9TRYP